MIGVEVYVVLTVFAQVEDRAKRRNSVQIGQLGRWVVLVLFFDQHFFKRFADFRRGYLRNRSFGPG